MKIKICKLAPGNIRGMTLIELVIAIAVIAILTGLAVPNYRNYVLRANRAEAMDILLATAACQERVYTKFHQYDTGRCMDDTTTPNGNYVLTMATANENQNYVLTATPQASQSEDTCGNLTLNDRGERGSSAAADAGQIADCWRGKRISGS